MTAKASLQQPVQQTDPAQYTAENGWQKGWCAMCLQNDCGMLVRIQDGVVTDTIGNPDTPTNKGKLCMRGGLASIPGYYDPNRIKKPLRRTNPKKGLDEDPRWEEISWEEAYSIVGKKMKEIRATDPRKMAFMEGWGICDELFGREIMFKNEETGNMVHGSTFGTAFGTVNNVPSHGVLCPIHFATNLVQAQHPEQVADLEYCNYLILPGRTLGPNSVCTHASQRMERALARGMKMVVLDPRHSIEASKAYKWLPILPGTELAFNLAMLHTILYEIGVYDVKFLKDRTNAPYIVGPDGCYLRDEATGKPMMIDSVDNQPKPFDQIEDPVLDAEITINGVQGKTGFKLLLEGMKEYTADWAEPITSIPAKEIREVAREFVDHSCIGQTITIDGFEFPFRPVQINGSGRGACSHQNGTHFDICCKLIAMLMGAMELPGATTGGGRPHPNVNILRPDEDGTVTPVVEAVPRDFHWPPQHVDGSEYYPHKHSSPQIVVRNMLNPERYHLDYKIEMFIFGGANPIRSISDQQLWVKALQETDMVVALQITHDESTTMADIVLPSSHFLEKDGIRIFKPPLQSIDDSLRGMEMILVRDPVPTLYDTKSSDQIFYDLAEAGGFLKEMNEMISKINRLSKPLEGDTKYDLETMWDRIIDDMFPGETYKSGQKVGQFVKQSVSGKEGYNYYYWPGNTTRHSFYIERLPRTAKRLREDFAKAGITHPAYTDQEEQFFKFYTGVPFWFPNKTQDVPADYDLYVMNWKTSFRVHGTGGNISNPWLNDMRTKDAYELYIHMNPVTAKEKNLTDGQDVWVESISGKTKGKVRLTELIHPKVLGFPGNYGGHHHKFINPNLPEGGAWFNPLLGGEEAQFVDPISGGLDISPKVKIYAA